MTSSFSEHAIRLASAARSTNQRVLFEFLYSYNSRPLSDNTTGSLAITDSGPIRSLDPIYTTEEEGGWKFWTTLPLSTLPLNASFRSKLYISVAQCGPDLVAKYVDLCAVHRPPQFKIARCNGRFIRADNWVVYFRDHDGLLAFADDFKAEISRWPPMGVPFTIKYETYSGLSWAEDPPSPPDAKLRHSFRGMLLNQVADILSRSNKIGSRIERAVDEVVSYAEAKGFRPLEWV